MPSWYEKNGAAIYRLQKAGYHLKRMTRVGEEDVQQTNRNAMVSLNFLDALLGLAFRDSETTRSRRDSAMGIHLPGGRHILHFCIPGGRHILQIG